VNIAAPAGAIISTARDMSRWMMWHLSGGAVPPSASRQPSESTASRQLIDKDLLWATYRECNPAFSKHYEPTTKNVSERHVAYDLGWMTSYYRGKAESSRNTDPIYKESLGFVTFGLRLSVLNII